jgi:hypothetical protein
MIKRKPLAALALATLAGCTSQADTVSDNLSREADSFKIHRQIVFYNGITDKYIAEIEGLCSLGNNDSAKQRTVTCKIGKDKYVKETFGLGDNAMVFSMQTEPVKTDPYRYKIIFKPESIIPDIDLQTSADK